MRIASFTMARNEESFAEAFSDQLEEFFDYSIVLDHNSTDGTAGIFARRLPPASIFRLMTSGYPQSELATLFARAVFTHTDADYLFFLDCDEFLPFANRDELETALGRTPKTTVPCLYWRNVSPLSMDGRDIFRGTFYQNPQVSAFKKVVLSREVFEATPDLVVRQGYHDLSTRAPLSRLSERGLYHIPVASRAKFTTKIVNSAARIMADPELKAKGLGTHWLNLLEVVQAGELDDLRLGNIALSYPSPDTPSLQWIPLNFSFPYIHSAYRETGEPPANAPDTGNASPRDFRLADIDGVLLYDSTQGDLTALGARIVSLVMGAASRTRKRPSLENGHRVQRINAMTSNIGSVEYPVLVSPLFSLPQKMPPTAWYGHIPFLFVLMEMTRPGRFVELGVHLGSSFIAACTATKSLGSETECLGVDTWEGDAHAGYYSGDRIYRDLSGYLQEQFPTARLIRAKFQDALKEIEDGSIDILHIDGLHTYEAVKDDYESWLPKVASDGVILFHDTNVFERGFGVHKLWAEIANDSNSLHFPHSFGLGVLLRDPDAPQYAPLKPLLENEDLRRMYYLLAADVGETIPFRMGYADIVANGHQKTQGSSVRASAQDLARAVRASARHRLANSPLWRLRATITR